MKMFCPKCGKEDEELFKGLCRSCFIKEFQMANPPHEMEFTICAHCDSTLEHGKWYDSELSEEELVEKTLIENINANEPAENVEVTPEILTIRGSIFDCMIHVEGNVFGEKVNEEYAVEVKRNRTMCPDCSKFASGYYESVIQVRADKRVLTREEIHDIDEIVKKRTRKLSEKNRMAYIAEVMKLKEGVDYYVGSYKAARSITNAIKDVFGGVVKESPKIAGRNKSTGKDLYRIWISLRLAAFQKGDFIGHGSHVGRVSGFDGKKIFLKDFDSHKTSSITWRDYAKIELLAGKDEVKKTTVTSKTPRSIQILHPETYEPVDIDLNEGISDLEIGVEVDVVEINGKLYILN
ncbi:NMD3 family protein [anaerobic digester metagenome]